MKKQLIIGIGEILWDRLPTGKQWGGAPANFAYHCQQFGADAWLVSAVGDDHLGTELLDCLDAVKLKSICPQLTYPTGVVDIELVEGMPSYHFNQNCAWDYIPASKEVLTLISSSDLVSFGSLAQRSPESRQAIYKMIDACPETCKVLFDINIRQHYYNKAIISDSLKRSDFLKLNDEEQLLLEEMFECSLLDLKEMFSIELIILTLGEKGSRIITDEIDDQLPSIAENVIDTVGAGDAFTACFIMNFLDGVDVSLAHKHASIAAAYVCTEKGATVIIPENIKEMAL